MKSLLIILVIFIGACDSGGDTPGQKSASLSTVITGIAAMGIVTDGTVTAYDFSDCQKGNQIAETKLLGTNQYEFTLPANSTSGPVLLELSNFTYTEESSRNAVNASTNILYGSFVLNAGQNQNVSISYWTNLAHARTTFLCNGASNLPSQHIQTSNDAFSGALLFDIIEVLPQQLDSNSVIFSDLDVIRYGVANAAISYFTFELDRLDGKNGHHDTYNSVIFAESAFDDLSYDNILNGFGEIAELAFGVTVLTSDTYRTTIPNNIYYTLAANDISPNSKKDEIAVVAEFLNRAKGLDVYPDTPVQATTKWAGPKIMGLSQVKCYCDFYGNGDNCAVTFELNVESKRIQFKVISDIPYIPTVSPSVKTIYGDIDPTQSGKPRFQVTWKGAYSSVDVPFLSQDEFGLSQSFVYRLNATPTPLCTLNSELISVSN